MAAVTSSALDRVFAEFGDLPYMDRERAEFLRSFLIEHELMELGFFHGKSSAVLASVLEERGRGHLTTFDLATAKNRSPSIEAILAKLDLSHRVTPVYSHRSFTWELCKRLKENSRPRFDFCYLDGAHTWDGTGFSFMLVDLLLRPGGWVIFDDLDWSIATSSAARKSPQRYKEYDDEERTARQVRDVWELLVPARGYVHAQELKKFHWGIAQKPLRPPVDVLDGWSQAKAVLEKPVSNTVRRLQKVAGSIARRRF